MATAEATPATRRAAWLEERKSGVGASESAALLGVSPWSTPLSVYASKVGEKEDKDETEIMEAGRRLQRPIAEWYAEKRAIAIEDLGEFTIQRSAVAPHAIATLDYWQINHPEFGACPLEIKNVSEWRSGDYKDDEVPLHVQVQAQHQAWVMGAKGVSVAWLLGGHRLRWHDYEARPDFAAALADTIEAFWTNHVEARVAPSPEAGKPDVDAAALGRLYGKAAGTAIYLPPEFTDLVVSLEDAKARGKKAENEEDVLKNRVKAFLGVHSVGILPDGRAFQWFVEPRSGYTVEPSEPRVLRLVKKPKILPT